MPPNPNPTTFTKEGVSALGLAPALPFPCSYEPLAPLCTLSSEGGLALKRCANNTRKLKAGGESCPWHYSLTSSDEGGCSGEEREGIPIVLLIGS